MNSRLTMFSTLLTRRIATLAFLLGHSLSAAEFFVSPDGNDANPGSAARPFKTIGQASRILHPGDSCVIGGGTYRETVVPPSGSASAPVIYRARPGEQVIISGCELVNSWSSHSGTVYKAPWKGTLGAGNQVFVNGTMVCQARWPDNPSGSLTAPPLATADQDSNKTTIRCAQLPSVDLSGAQVWIMSGTRWEAWTSTIERSAAGSITFADRSYDAIACRPGASFYVFGSLALLSENEWATDGGFLYLQPPGGVNPGSLTVEAKARYYGLDLSHRQHVQLHGIQLFGCSIKTDSATDDILIDGMSARYVGHWETPGNARPPKEQLVAMAMEGRDITLQNSTLYGAAGTLVTLNGSGNRIINCLISEAGYAGLNSECVGIYGSRQLVSHNTIHSSGRSVLGFGATRSKVAFNDVSRAGLLTWDVGLFTTGNTDAGHSEVCFNWFHDNLSEGLARGIFLSTGTHNLLIHHNVVWHCWEGGFHGEPPMEYVQLINNTFYSTPDSYDAGGVDISSFTYVDDQVGGYVLNNVFTDDIRTLGHDVTIAGNLLKGSDPQFVAPEKFDFRLKPSSPARALGQPIKGISAKVGAGAYGEGDWKPGHDFKNPPRVKLTFSESPFRNRVLNSSFESGLDSWETTGPAGKVSRQPLDADPTTNTDGPVHSGRSAMRLAGSGSGLRQATIALSPDSTYILTCWAKLTAANAAATLGVTGAFGTKTFRFESTAGPSTWLRGSVAFSTGPREESVTVFFQNSGEAGAADVLVDDIGLVQSLTPEPLLTTARADIELNRGNGFDQFDLSGHWQRSESWTLGDRARVRFHGRQAILYARVFERGGIAAVSIDDGPETLVDCYYPQLPHHATVQPIIPVFRSPLLPRGPHALTLRVTGDKNPASQGKAIRPAYLSVLE